MSTALLATQKSGTRRARLLVAATAALALVALMTTATALASDPAFVRAFGKGVNSSGNSSENPDICTTSCRGGTLGTAAGEFSDLADLSVAGSGYVYAADNAAQRIDEYNQDGTFVRALGKGVNSSGNSSENPDVCTTSCRAGSSAAGAGDLGGPWDVQVAASGDLYVVAASANRVEEFKPDGTFVRAFGKGVNSSGNSSENPDVCTTSCQAGSSGSSAGELSSPNGIAIAGAGAGDLYVTDYGNYRVAEYKQDGTFVRAFASGVGGPGVDVCTTKTGCQTGTWDTAPAGAVRGPEGISIANAGAGDVYVAAYNDNRIDEFKQDGTFVRAFGKGVNTSGTPGENPDVCTTSCQEGSSGASGTPDLPEDVAVAGSGDVYVAEYANDRIDEFKQDGTFVRAFGKNVNGSGNSSENPDVCTTSCRQGAIGTGAGDEIRNPNGVAVADSGDLYIADSGNRRIDVWSPAKATPMLKTHATPSASVGEPVSDTATLSGGNSPTGTVTFKAYASSTCSGAAAFTSQPVTVARGSASSGPFKPTQAGSYYWTASYSGDAANAAVSSACNADPGETSVVSQPTSKPSPKCVLRPLSSHVKVVSAGRHGRKTKRHVLELRVTCDQAAALRLTGTITASFKARPGRRAPKAKRFKLAPVRAAAQANRSLTLTVRVPKGALALLARGAKESAAFSLTATNANGRSTVAATIASLKP